MPTTTVPPDPTATSLTYTAFAGHKRVASGTREEMLRATKRFLDRTNATVLIFEDASGR